MSKKNQVHICVLSQKLNSILSHAFFILACAVAVISVSSSVYAGDLEWSGLYRVEGYNFQDLLLDSSDAKRKEYGVHTLILRPKIVAADGLYINAQFSIFNADTNTTGDERTALGNQLGAYFGNGPGNGVPTDSTNSNTLAENQESEQIRVTHFYLTHVQEFGSLIVGRAPQHFGLGMTHNAGRGIFDHYADTRDLVGYKVMLGNFFFYPSYAKINEGSISGNDDVNEWNYQLQYENPENDVAMGVYLQNRVGSQGGNDTPATIGGSANNGSYETKNFNVFYKKETDNWTVGFEVAQQSGDTGVNNASGKEISYGGFGATLELDWHAKEKSTAWGLRAGFATGDDPSTDDEFEGFIFDRNYDVAMLMFNHGMGQADFLHTRNLGRKDAGTVFYDRTVNSEPDVEAISNVTFLALTYKKKWSDKWALVGVLTTGWLDDDSVDADDNTATAAVKADTDLGYELDLSLEYKISDKIMWLNQFGYLSPGKAWEADGQFDADTAMGFVTKAAVSF